MGVPEFQDKESISETQGGKGLACLFRLSHHKKFLGTNYNSKSVMILLFKDIDYWRANLLKSKKLISI